MEGTHNCYIGVLLALNRFQDDIDSPQLDGNLTGITFARLLFLPLPHDTNNVNQVLIHSVEPKVGAFNSRGCVLIRADAPMNTFEGARSGLHTCPHLIKKQPLDSYHSLM